MDLRPCYERRNGDLCLKCDALVTGRQKALSCDGCHRWVHRTCGTGKINDYNFLIK